MKYAVLMVVDGLRSDMVTPALTPTLARHAAEARVFTQHRCVFPSATRINSASIATGCYPGSHGLAGNAVALDDGTGLKAVSVGPPGFRDLLRRVTGRTLQRPTLAERVRERGGAIIYSNSSAGSAHMQDPDGHGTLYHRNGSFEPGLTPVTKPAHLDVSHDGAGDAATTARFCDAFLSDRTTPLWVLWICEPDHSQHVLELGSPAHLEVLRAADACVAGVLQAVQQRRAAGDDVLFVVCSDHGHETVEEIVPVAELLVDAGLKNTTDSSDVVLASSGMGALVYVADDVYDRGTAIAEWLRRQEWVDRLYAHGQLAEAGHRIDSPLAILFGLAKRDAPNRHGVRGHGHVAADLFTTTDAAGCGQHGGFGPYESNPFLQVSGGGFAPGPTDYASRAVDIAPTVLTHLELPITGIDGRPLPPR